MRETAAASPTRPKKRRTSGKAPDDARPPASEPLPDGGIAERLLDWFDRHGRHDLPWQHPRTPYRVWLSEIMLQQTQVSVVIGYFQRFVAALPDLPALAAAPLDQALALWSGLGYYARARNLHAAARICVERHDGELPQDLDALMTLPGIGRSTAGAILSQAWGERAPVLDGNVKRVLCRLQAIEGWPGSTAIEKRLWTLAQSLLPEARMADYTQALMDLGATVCTRANPDCDACPLRGTCRARRQGRAAELPTPRPGKRLPLREAHMLILRDGEGRVLLERRLPVGLWAALWSLPEQPDLEHARAWFTRHFRSGFGNAQPLEPLLHGFSHYRLKIQPLLIVVNRPRDAIADNDGMRWATLSELSGLGLPAPVRKLLQEFQT